MAPTQLVDTAFRSNVNAIIEEYFTMYEGTASKRLVDWEAFKVVVRGAAIKTSMGAIRRILWELTNIETQMGSLKWETTDDPNRLPNLLATTKRHEELIEQLRVYDNRIYTHRTHVDRDKLVSY
ncbi:hypothetical protein NDU88_010277 [Pleurodeles waltl]|uniref:Uncharacterized protein n=1 Tax=Pleurodeles waltl TaxID=8319 RepID=A0AAV7S0V8_PLEWA|nr:hypothetical protein NDU88_010277 [Pleurodeles waltl]